jgi:hypothetical protein
LTALAAAGRVQHTRHNRKFMHRRPQGGGRADLPRIARANAAGAGAQLAVGQNVCMTDPPIDHDSLADLTGELRYLLTRWDPIGIYNEALDFPPDEHDFLIAQPDQAGARRQPGGLQRVPAERDREPLRARPCPQRK